jgi:hypothetical protein
MGFKVLTAGVFGGCGLSGVGLIAGDYGLIKGSIT